MAWINKNLESHFSEQLEKIRDLGFSKEALAARSLKNLALKTTSDRYGRMIKLAFHLGRLSGIQEADRILASPLSPAPDADDVAVILIAAEFEAGEENPYTGVGAWKTRIFLGNGKKRTLSGTSKRASYSGKVLYPLLQALKYLEKTGPLPRKITLLLSDQYLIDVFNKGTWKKWPEHEWKTKRGTTVPGMPFWRDIYSMAKDIEFKAEHAEKQHQGEFFALLEEARGDLARAKYPGKDGK